VHGPVGTQDLARRNVAAAAPALQAYCTTSIVGGCASHRLRASSWPAASLPTVSLFEPFNPGETADQTDARHGGALFNAPTSA